MKYRHLPTHILVLLLSIVTSSSCLQGQMQPDAGYKTKREQALHLFNKDKRLEALPLLEELAQKNPKDEEVVVAFAASLVTHAASLTDLQAAASERVRAKNLLEKLDTTSPLAGNLLQLLRAMPDNGQVQFSDDTAVEEAIQAGEAAFSRRDFDEAIKNYFRALELEPGNYPATLFIGNTFFKKNDFDKAAGWYEKAIELDPNVETAYRYYAEMLARKGEMDRSRRMLIQAVVAEPYNRIVWRDLLMWASLNNTKLDFEYAGVLSNPEIPKRPAPEAPAKDGPWLDVKFFQERPKDLSDAWQAYQSVHEDWKEGGKFNQQFPQEAGYRHSLAEETEALAAEVKVLEKLRSDIETAELVTENQSPLLLLRLHQAGVLEAYVLFRLSDEGIAKDYSAYRSVHRDKLEEYMDKFVVPPAPSRTN